MHICRFGAVGFLEFLRFASAPQNGICAFVRLPAVPLLRAPIGKRPIPLPLSWCIQADGTVLLVEGLLRGNGDGVGIGDQLTSQEIGKGRLNRHRIGIFIYCLVIFYKIVVLLRVCTYNNKYVSSVCGENVCSYSGSGGETVLCYDDDR